MIPEYLKESIGNSIQHGGSYHASLCGYLESALWSAANLPTWTQEEAKKDLDVAREAENYGEELKRKWIEGKYPETNAPKQVAA